MSEQPTVRQRREYRYGGRREHRVNLRLSEEEFGTVARAAEKAGETTAGYVARLSLIVAAGGEYERLERAVETIGELALRMARVANTQPSVPSWAPIPKVAPGVRLTRSEADAINQEFKWSDGAVSRLSEISDELFRTAYELRGEWR